MKFKGHIPPTCAHAQMFTRRERRKCAESLVCVLQALTGQQTKLELRNELSVSGTIISVDSCMNTTLKDAEITKMNDDRERFDELTVRGCQIRYVHIPGDFDVMEAIEKQVYVLLPEAGGRKETRKGPSRAKQLRLSQEQKRVREYKLGRGRGRGGGTTVDTKH